MQKINGTATEEDVNVQQPRTRIAGEKPWAQHALQEVKRLRSIVGAGLLAALGTVLKALSITIIPNVLRISFFFLPTALSGFFYGPFVAGFAAMIIDIFGYLLKPDGMFFFGFTFNAFLNGFIYGAWLYRRKVSLWRTVSACVNSMVLINFLLNPLWLSMLYGSPWYTLFIARVPANLITLPINAAMLFGLLKLAEKHRHILRRA